MIQIPFSINETEYNIFIALQKDNPDRIQKYDPAQLNINRLPPEFQSKRLNTVLIGFATEEDIQHCLKLCNSGNPRLALEYLARGFEFNPKAGDHDGPALSLRARPGERPV